LFPKEKLVYLSPESKNILTEIDHSKVYIIGGIVDDNRLKGISFQKATEQEIYTSKFPIKQYVQNYSTQSLNVNHAFAIMLDVAAHNDWSKAFADHIPKRKGYVCNQPQEKRSKSPTKNNSVSETDENKTINNGNSNQNCD